MHTGTINKRQFLGLMGAAGLVSWETAHAAAGVGESEIILGQSLDLSGPLAEMANDMMHAVHACFDPINQQGGIHGRKIRVITEDDGYKPEKTVSNVQKMLAGDGVFALCNLTGTANVAALLPTLAQENPPLPLITPFTGADVVRTPAINHVFNLRASYGDEIEKLVQHLTTLGVPRIAVVWTDNAFGKDGLDGARKSMGKRGQKIDIDAPINPDSSNAAQAAATLAAAEPTAIIMITAGTPTVSFIKAYRKISRAARFYTLSVMGSPGMLRALGEDGVGVVVTTVVPFPWSQSQPLAREYRAALQKVGHESSVSFVGLEAYMNARLIIEGLRRTGRELTRPRFVQALEGLRNYDLGDFKISFGSGLRQGSRFVELTFIGKGARFTR